MSWVSYSLSGNIDKDYELMEKKMKMVEINYFNYWLIFFFNFGTQNFTVQENLFCYLF